MVAHVRRAISQEQIRQLIFITGSPDSGSGINMAGHNKWFIVKCIKGAINVWQEKVFSRRAKTIAAAAKLGVPAPGAPLRLHSDIPLA